MSDPSCPECGTDDDRYHDLFCTEGMDDEVVDDTLIDFEGL